MISGKQKLFRDPVHGYISVSEDICRGFIDTAIFQRLRGIEQTSMRPLYPSAHHDRFAHSLGVYNLASIAFDHLKRNTSSSCLDPKELDKYKDVFLIAALMHDCGHSPFSHTFEEFYNRNQRAEKFLFEEVEKTDSKFRPDYDSNYKNFGRGPADHEIFSAGIFLKHYRNSFSEICPDIDPAIVARMITGCLHDPANSRNEEIVNCLTLLINGRAIDVDKLDYILRDTWASGVNNVTIDVHRLLSALELASYDGRLVPAFNKSALSVIQSVLDGRNFLYNWIYSHHTVCYYTRLLYEAVKKLSRCTSQTNDQLIDTIFSAGVFEAPILVGTASLYLPSDGDLFYLLKQHQAEIPEVQELLARKPKLVPLWKTYAEYEFIFSKKKGDVVRAKIQSRIQEILSSLIPDAKRILTLRVKPKMAVIHEEDLFLSIQKEVVPLTQVAITPTIKENVSYFLVFIPKEFESKIGDCIAAIQGQKAY